ncbi:hypothetical protein HDU76_006296 [Blyttiomyces sp. JEL0837]|nr:hypothetical protein HDU76_006296 [Blyttiomyces sp. JEL0837]
MGTEVNGTIDIIVETISSKGSTIFLTTLKNLVSDNVLHNYMIRRGGIAIRNAVDHGHLDMLEGLYGGFRIVLPEVMLSHNILRAVWVGHVGIIERLVSWGGDVSGGDVLQCLLERLWVRDGGGGAAGNSNNGANRNRIRNSTWVLKTLVHAGLKMVLGNWYRLLNRAVLLADVDAVRVILKAAGFERAREGYRDVMVFHFEFYKMLFIVGKRGNAKLIRLLMAYNGHDLGVVFTSWALMEAFDRCIICGNTSSIYAMVKLGVILEARHLDILVSKIWRQRHPGAKLLVKLMERVEIGDSDLELNLVLKVLAGLLGIDLKMGINTKQRKMKRLGVDVMDMSVSFTTTQDFIHKLPVVEMVELNGLIIHDRKHNLDVNGGEYVWDVAVVFEKLQSSVKEKTEILKYIQMAKTRRTASGKLVVDTSVQVGEPYNENVIVGIRVDIKEGETGGYRGNVEEGKVGERGVKDEDGRHSEQSRWVNRMVKEAAKWHSEANWMTGQVGEPDKEQMNVGNGVGMKEEGEMGGDRGDVEKREGGEGVVKDEIGTRGDVEKREGGEGVVKDEIGTRGDQVNDEKGEGSGEMDENKADGDENDSVFCERKEESANDGNRMKKGDDSDFGDMREENDSGGEQMNGETSEGGGKWMIPRHGGSKACDEKDKVDGDMRDGGETRGQINDDEGEGGGRLDEIQAGGEDEKDCEDCGAKNIETRGEQVDDVKGAGCKCIEKEENEAFGEFVDVGNGVTVKEESDMRSSEVVNDNKVNEDNWERESEDEKSETRGGDSVGVVVGEMEDDEIMVVR